MQSSAVGGDEVSPLEFETSGDENDRMSGSVFTPGLVLVVSRVHEKDDN